MKTIRIFISSPGDVAVERDKARKDGRKWNDEIRDDFALMRRLGHDHPDMQKIEEMLGEGE